MGSRVPGSGRGEGGRRSAGVSPDGRGAGRADQAPAARRGPDACGRASEARRGRRAGGGRSTGHRRARGKERAGAADGGQTRPAVDPGLDRAKRRYS